MKRHGRPSNGFWRVRVTDIIRRSQPGARHSSSGSGRQTEASRCLKPLGLSRNRHRRETRSQERFTAGSVFVAGFVKGLAILGESVEAQRRLGLPMGFRSRCHGWPRDCCSIQKRMPRARPLRKGFRSFDEQACDAGTRSCIACAEKP